MHYSNKQIIALHKKYAPSDVAFNLVFTHCQIVCDIANQLIAKGNLNVDIELVTVGSMLHDIGVYPLLREDGKVRGGIAYITHGTEGESLLQKEGFSEMVYRFASHRTGVGLTKEDVIALDIGLPVVDFMAETDEEALVMYADKFHSKTDPPYFNSFASYRQHIAQFGEHKATAFDDMAIRFGLPDLELLSKKYGHAIK